MLFPTTLVGSYPQPDWLIDRAKLAGRFPPRVRAKELWRIPPEFLAEAQNDATLIAIRAQEDAGLDIITDGEIRRESYSNRFATALEGIDIDNPGTALDRSGHPNPVPRIVGKIRRRHAVEVDDVKFLRAHTTRRIKITVPGPFTMSQQAQNEFYATDEEASLGYAAAVNEEIKDLFAAGADIVQIDEPYMQARPEKARQYGLSALNRALEGVTGTTCVHICFGYARVGRLSLRTDLDRDRAVESGLLGADAAQGQADSARRDQPRRHAGGNGRDGGWAHPSRAPVRGSGAYRRVHRLRHEVPAARRGRRQDARDGGRRCVGAKRVGWGLAMTNGGL
jgi:methionine synthase II (cobalamin-independent)